MEFNKKMLIGVIAAAGVLAAICQETNAAKTNDVTYDDILDWADQHATKHRLSKKHHAPSLDDLMADVKKDKLQRVHSSRTCAENALLRCDISSMAKLLMPDDTPCTLVKEYQRCIYHEIKRCPNGEARQLITSLDNLIVGLQTGGHCMDLATATNSEYILLETRPSRPCGRRGVWMCTTALVEDLKSLRVNACSAFANYRHCIHQGTQPCTNRNADALLKGTKGLARLYRKLSKQC